MRQMMEQTGTWPYDPTDICEKRAFSREKWLVCLIFLSSVCIRWILGCVYGERCFFYDELLHMKLAENLARHGKLIFRGLPKAKNDCLYYFLLYPAFRFENRQWIQGMILGINSLSMSAVVFPVYGLSRRLLKTPALRLALCLLCVCLPEMCYTSQVLQENLFYPLFLVYAFWFLKEEGAEDKRAGAGTGGIEKTGEIRKYRQGRQIREQIQEQISVIILGVLAYLLYLTKDLGMVVILATQLIWLVNGLKSGVKHGGKESGTVCIWRKPVLFVSTILVAEFLFQPIFQELIPEMEIRLLGASNLQSILVHIHSDIQRLEGDALLRALGVLLQYMATYFTQFVLLTGILPVLVVLSGYLSREGGGKTSEEKSLFQLGISYLCLLILATCVLEIENELKGSQRIFYRYLFETAPLFWLLFFSHCERQIVSKKSFLFWFGLYLLGILLCFLVPDQDYSVCDCISANVLLRFYVPGRYWKLKLIFIVTGLFSAALVLFRKWRLALCFVFIGLMGTGIYSARQQYLSVYTVRQREQPVIADILQINDYLRNTAGGYLLIPEEGMSMAVAECYLNLDYYVCPKAGFIQYQETAGRPEESLPVLSVTTYFQKEGLPAMRYLIAEDELAVDGYEMISLPLNRYFLYRKED